jgi:hypothetical protein
MSKIEQKTVDHLIEQYTLLMYGLPMNECSIGQEIIEACIIDNQNTIDALEAIPDLKVVGNILLDIIEHYQAIKTILKSKLK